MTTVLPEVKYQALKTFEVEEMIEPGVSMLDKDGNRINVTYDFGDVLPEGTVRQWGDQALRRMINNELIVPIGHWESSDAGGRGKETSPASRSKSTDEDPLGG